MSDENVASGLVQVAASALFDGRAVAIRIDGEAEWEAISRVSYGPNGPALVEVVRARDGHTLFVPAGRIVAVDVGQMPG